MDRGNTVYQDLWYIFYMVVTNAAILTVLFFCLLFFMAHYGYKSITIKLNKKNQLVKQLRKHQKFQEKKYINKLETDFNHKKKRDKFS